jgi:hypothetical protein
MSTTTTAPPKQEEILERLQRLVERAEQGDEAALPELRVALDVNPWCWQRYGDLAQQSMAAWLQLIAGSNLMLHESTRRKAEQLRAELAGPGPSPLERLLAERVVACWLQTNYADATYAQLKGATPAQHTAALRRQNSAEHRYLQSVRALVTIRKLLRPGLSPVDLAMRPVPEQPAGRLAGASVPADGEPVLNRLRGPAGAASAATKLRPPPAAGRAARYLPPTSSRRAARPRTPRRRRPATGRAPRRRPGASRTAAPCDRWRGRAGPTSWPGTPRRACRTRGWWTSPPS